MRWKVQVWELVKEGLVGHTVEGFLQVDEDTPDTHPPLKERVASVHSNYVGCDSHMMCVTVMCQL